MIHPDLNAAMKRHQTALRPLVALVWQKSQAWYRGAHPRAVAEQTYLYRTSTFSGPPRLPLASHSHSFSIVEHVVSSPSPADLCSIHASARPAVRRWNGFGPQRFSTKLHMSGVIAPLGNCGRSTLVTLREIMPGETPWKGFLLVYICRLSSKLSSNVRVGR